MAFKIEELTFGDSSVEEQERTRQVFLSLVASANAGETLTEHEKEFLYTGLSMSQANDGHPDQFVQCDNPKFKWLALVYMDDLTGGSVFVKPSVGKGQDSSGRLRNVPIPEAQADLRYLIEKAEEFELVIQKDAPQDRMLQETISELRKELKILNKQPEYINDPYFSGRFRYRYPRWRLLIGFKWIYHFCQEIYETQNNLPFVFHLNTTPVEITEYSLVHIISRHFFAMLRNYETGKSYHQNGAFMPRILGTELKSIFDEVMKHRKLKRVDKVFFVYKGVINALWTGEQSRFIKGKGEVKFIRLETLYPLEQASELEKLQNKHTLIKINNDISIYEEN